MRRGQREVAAYLGILAPWPDASSFDSFKYGAALDFKHRDGPCESLRTWPRYSKPRHTIEVVVGHATARHILNDEGP